MQMCGTGSMENRSRLYFPNPANLTERRFCVAECPVQVSQTLDEPVRLGLVEGDSELLVRNGSTSDSCFDPRSRRRQQAADASPRWPCFYPTYPTIEAFYKCVPVPPPVLALSELEGFPAEARIYTAAARFVAAPLGALGNAAGELHVTWPYIAGSTGVALVFALVWLALLRYFTLCLVVTVGTAVLGGALGVTLLAWDKQGAIAITRGNALEAVLASIEISPSGALAAAVGLSIGTALLFLLAVFLARRVLVAVRLIQEASRAVADMPSVLAFPLSTLLSLALLTVLAATAALFLASAGSFDPAMGAFTLVPPFPVLCPLQEIRRGWGESRFPDPPYMIYCSLAAHDPLPRRPLRATRAPRSAG